MSRDAAFAMRNAASYLAASRAMGSQTFAYYDPPWTLPFLRRNEVLQPVR